MFASPPPPPFPIDSPTVFNFVCVAAVGDLAKPRILGFAFPSRLCVDRCGLSPSFCASSAEGYQEIAAKLPENCHRPPQRKRIFSRVLASRETKLLIQI